MRQFASLKLFEDLGLEDDMGEVEALDGSSVVSIESCFDLEDDAMVF